MAEINNERLERLGSALSSRFKQYEADRSGVEQQWLKAARQYAGVYDPEVDKTIEAGRSKAYPKLTRVKCISMLSRLMNLLFPTSEKNWTISPSPVPNLAAEDLELVLSTVLASAEGGQVTDVEVELAIMEFAKARSRNLELEIDDQLAELGGSRSVDYVSLCRKVIMSGIVYGLGVLKGPFVRKQQQRTWVRTEGGNLAVQNIEAYRPHFEFVPVWDYFPDMSARYFHQMDGQFQRIVMAQHQLRELADRDDFKGGAIKKYLANNREGNYRPRTVDTELRSYGPQERTSSGEKNKYEVIVWDGYVSGHDLAAAGVDVPEARLGERHEAIVWLLDTTVIKAEMNPWVQLDVGTKVNSYHQFVFEEDESCLTGTGLPQVMRDSQMAVSNASRMLLDNAGVVCGPNLEVNLDLMHRDTDVTGVHAYKTWYREGLGSDAQVPAVRELKFDSHISELTGVVDMFRGFADTETFVNQLNGGDLQSGPSEPLRTATGASLLKSDAALPFRDVVRNFDLFTQSVLSSIVAFNSQFNTKPTLRGDHQVIPRGAASLMAKEVRGMILDNLAVSLSPEDQRYINRYELLRARLATRDIDLDSGILCDKEEARRRDDAATQEQQQQAQRVQDLMQAEVRKTLSDAAKGITQADKNAAGAAATSAKARIEEANAVLTALEGGLNGGQEPGAGSAGAAAPQPKRSAGAGDARPAK